MNSIEKAELYFILPINNLLELKSKLEEDQFLQKLNNVQIDEFNEKLCASISRNKIFDGKISYQEYKLPLKIYVSNYHDYNSSLIYLNVSIQKSIKLNDFLSLIYEKNLLHNTYVNNKTLFGYLSQNLVDCSVLDDVFLFLQIAETNPKFPKTYDEGIKYIKKYKQKINQLLLRSLTYHDHLRIDNHQSNFNSIANFYGTIDLCSPVTLIQFYQYDINFIGTGSSECNEVDMDHRACWWLVITDMIFIQKSILADTLKKISQVQMNEKMKTVKPTTQIGKVLLNMRDFWYFEDLTHEMSKAVIFRVKEKVGVTSMLNSVIERVEYLENMILREINEEQNEHNYYLNIIVLIIAMIQIVPLIHGVINSVFIENTEFLATQLWLWIQSFLISLTLPLLILILRKISKRKFSSAILAIKKSKTKIR